MNIGVPCERRPHESRVGLTPAGVRLVRSSGHEVLIEHHAGLGAGFDDGDYLEAGAHIVYSGEEAYGRADMVLKVARPTNDELEWLVPGQALVGLLHLHASRPAKVEAMLRKGITAIAYEQICLDDGTLPVRRPLSQICGRMAAQIAARLLQNNYGGKGVLLGGVPGVPPANVVIIGAGTVGTNAARAFLGLGATVFVLDRDLARLHAVDELFLGRVVTMVSHEFNVAKVCTFADVLVGAVLVPGQRTPVIVTREMVRSMRPRAVVVDLSIDDGGCVETSRPTAHGSPTFVDEGVIHYCVPNVPGVVARTATHAYLNAAWPYIQAMVASGVDRAVAADRALERGVNIYHGELRNLAVPNLTTAPVR